MAFPGHWQRLERRHEQRHVRSKPTLAAVHRCDASDHADYRGHAFGYDDDGRRQFQFWATGNQQHGFGKRLTVQYDQYIGNANPGDANDATASGRLSH